MTRLATLTFDQALGEAPDWVHLLPLGRTVARDGRVFVLDNPEAVVAAFEMGGVDLPVDYEHQHDKRAKGQTGPIPAAGWIKELALRADGLWGRVEWTARARALIAAREYRYLSPSMMVSTEDQSVVRLKGAGLVHAPALHLTALAEQESDMPDLEAPEDELPEGAPLYTRIAKLLGLPEDADEAEIVAALRALLRDGAKPDPRRFVPAEAMQAALQERHAYRQERAVRKVEQAFQAGYLTTPMKAWALDLCATDEAAFDRFLETAVPAFAHLTREVLPGLPPASGAGHASPEAAAVARQLGLAEDALSG